MRTRFAMGILVAGALGTSAGTAAQPGRAAVREGNRLYEEGRYEEARQRYLDALREAPDSPIARFNAANAAYQTQDFAEALEAYRAALAAGDPALQADAWYNLGNALYRQQAFQEAAEAYKEALRTDPADVDAKHNLERALEQLQQQPQQQQGGDDQQQDQPPQQQQPQPGPQPEGEQPPPEQPENQDQPSGRDEQPRDGQPEGQDQQQPAEAEPSQEQSAQPEQREGTMTPEQARQLLQAINEDPGEIRRQDVRRARRSPLRKNW